MHKIWLLSCKELIHCIFLNSIWYCLEGDLSYFISAHLVFQLDYILLKRGLIATIPFELPSTAQPSIYSWIPFFPELSLTLNVTDIPRGKQRKVEILGSLEQQSKYWWNQEKGWKWTYSMSLFCLQGRKANYLEYSHNISEFSNNIYQSQVMSQVAWGTMNV